MLEFVCIPPQPLLHPGPVLVLRIRLLIAPRWFVTRVVVCVIKQICGGTTVVTGLGYPRSSPSMPCKARSLVFLRPSVRPSIHPSICSFVRSCRPTPPPRGRLRPLRRGPTPTRPCSLSKAPQSSSHNRGSGWGGARVSPWGSHHPGPESCPVSNKPCVPVEERVHALQPLQPLSSSLGQAQPQPLDPSPYTLNPKPHKRVGAKGPEFWTRTICPCPPSTAPPGSHNPGPESCPASQICVCLWRTDPMPCSPCLL